MPSESILRYVARYNLAVLERALVYSDDGSTGITLGAVNFMIMMVPLAFRMLSVSTIYCAKRGSKHR